MSKSNTDDDNHQLEMAIFAIHEAFANAGKIESFSVEEAELLLKASEEEYLKVRAEIEAKAGGTPQIGAVESDGDHKGEIYGGIFPDGKPIWFSAAPKLMDHYNAAAWAEGQGGSLPTRKQGDYLTTLKGKGGAFTEIFNRGNSFPAGYVWLAEPSTNFRGNAWCQRLSGGDQDSYGRDYELPVLSVFR